MTAADSRHPYEALTPDVVQDALASVGLFGDGRLLALSSYENRVYQLWLESPHEGAEVVVAKFYRPGRWTDAQILEEHAFAAELEAGEVPVAAPWPLSADPSSLHAEHVRLIGDTLGSFELDGETHRYAATGRVPGRAPEVEDPDTLEWIGRYVGRIHAIGSRGRFEHPLTVDVETFGAEPRAWLLASDLVPPDALPSWRDLTLRALERVAACWAEAGNVR